MGGAVSSGRNNNELVDNLMEGSYIRTEEVERVFRALDRREYMVPGDRERAYKDIAWRNGHLHLSSPCIYSEVMEGLEVKPGLSFLNIGSGTGYLSTMVGLILGSGGISHGIEIYPNVVDYANTMQRKFIENSPAIDDFDFCEPKFFLGNGLCLAPLLVAYDRVYCGAACPDEYATYFKQLIRIGGVLVMPLNDTLVQVRRVGVREWTSRSLLNVSFAPLQLPPADTGTDAPRTLTLEEQSPPALQVLSRGAVRRALHRGVLQRHPELREAPRAPQPRRPRTARHARRCPRRICIPIDEERARTFNMFHDLDREDGANEMNALLSLVLSMGENRVAGALRLGGASDTSPSASSAEDGSEPETEPEPQPAIDGAPPARDNAAPTVEADATSTLRRTIDMVFRNQDPGREGEGDREEEAVSPRSLTVEFHDGAAGGAEGAVRDAAGGAADVGAEPLSQAGSAARDLPADVDVYLDNTEDPRGSSASDMEWEESRTEGRREPSSDDTESASKGTEEKRKKLDSGIGEGNSPSSSSQEKTERSAASDTGDGSDDVEPPIADGRRRQKRLRTLAPASSSEEEWSECEGELRRRAARRAPFACSGDAASDLRRQRRARLLRLALADLPLPLPLKVYLNWGRALPR